MSVPWGIWDERQERFWREIAFGLTLLVLDMVYDPDEGCYCEVDEHDETLTFTCGFCAAEALLSGAIPNRWPDPSCEPAAPFPIAEQI